MDKKGIGTAGKIGIIVAIIIIAFIVLLAMNGTEHYDLGETRYGEVVFTEGPATDYDQYVEKTDATYESDEDVWVYADIDDVGLILGEEEGTGEEGAWVQVGTWMTVEDDEGNTIIERTQVMNPEEEQGWRVAHDDEDTLDEIIETFHITYVIEAHELEEGDYELILEIEDRVSDDTDEWTGTFTVGDVDDEEVDETNTLTVDANQNGGQVNVYNGID